jgi:AraC-like DNA-binding protein
MKITLTQSDISELYEATDFVETELSPQFYEVTGKAPELLGNGSFWEIDLCEGIVLGIDNWQNPNLCTVAAEEREHEIEINMWIPICSQKSHCTLFGSGIAPKEIWKSPANEEGIYIYVGFEPDLLKMLYGRTSDELPPELQILMKTNDWQPCWRDRPVTPAMHAIVRDIQACPYQGLIKQIYLQGKVFELLALQIKSLQGEQTSLFPYYLKRSTVERIYRARELLLTDLEHSPSILELARQVGVSDRTLRRGFRQIFGTTVIGYLMNQRLEQAEQMLRDRHLAVAEVACRVGYSNASRFAAAFKQKYGISPSDCLIGKKSVY